MKHPANRVGLYELFFLLSISTGVLDTADASMLPANWSLLRQKRLVRRLGPPKLAAVLDRPRLARPLPPLPTRRLPRRLTSWSTPTRLLPSPLRRLLQLQCRLRPHLLSKSQRQLSLPSPHHRLRLQFRRRRQRRLLHLRPSRRHRLLSLNRQRSPKFPTLLPRPHPRRPFLQPRFLPSSAPRPRPPKALPSQRSTRLQSHCRPTQPSMYPRTSATSPTLARLCRIVLRPSTATRALAGLSTCPDPWPALVPKTSSLRRSPVPMPKKLTTAVRARKLTEKRATRPTLPRPQLGQPQRRLRLRERQRRQRLADRWARLATLTTSAATILRVAPPRRPAVPSASTLVPASKPARVPNAPPRTLASAVSASTTAAPATKLPSAPVSTRLWDRPSAAMSTVTKEVDAALEPRCAALWYRLLPRTAMETARLHCKDGGEKWTLVALHGLTRGGFLGRFDSRLF